MDEDKRDRLELKLKKMLNHLDQTKSKERNQYLSQVSAILFDAGLVKKKNASIASACSLV